MEEGNRDINPKSLSNSRPDERERIEHLFNMLKSEGLTPKECLYLAAFLISFFGLTFQIKWYRGVAKAMFDSIVDIEKQNIDMLNQTISSIEGVSDGLSSRGDVDQESKTIS